MSLVIALRLRVEETLFVGLLALELRVEDWPERPPAGQCEARLLKRSGVRV
jgi:hypothetical protein